MIKKFLKNKFGSVNLSYTIILSVCCVIGVIAINFIKIVNNLQTKSSTNIETQGVVSPSLSVS